MVQIVGTYKAVEKINPEGILKAAGREPDATTVAGFISAEIILTITGSGDSYNFTSKFGDSLTKTTSFTIGQSFEEDGLTAGQKVTTTATKDGNKITLATQGGGRTFEFNDTGVVMTLTHDSSCKIVYKRV